MYLEYEFTPKPISNYDKRVEDLHMKRSLPTKAKGMKSHVSDLTLSLPVWPSRRHCIIQTLQETRELITPL